MIKFVAVYYYDAPQLISNSNVQEGFQEFRIENQVNNMFCLFCFVFKKPCCPGITTSTSSSLYMWFVHIDSFEIDHTATVGDFHKLASRRTWVNNYEARFRAVIDEASFAYFA
jgi:hypothetical protein